MSLLNEISNPDADLKKKVSRIRYINLTIIKEIIRFWNESNDSIWNGSNTQQILDELGEDAEEVLEIDKEILNLLSNILGGRRQSELDSIIAKISTRPQISTDSNGNTKII